jgi:hypothetical protein
MTTATYKKASRPGWNEGSAAVEAAITLSALLFLIFGIIEFGMAFWQWNTLLFMVEQTGRYMMVNTSCIAVGNCQALADSKMQSVMGTTNQPQLCTTTGTLINAPPLNKVCVYAFPPTAANPQSNPPIPATMTLVAEYNMDWALLDSLTKNLGKTSLNFPVLQSQIIVPLD